MKQTWGNEYVQALTKADVVDTLQGRKKLQSQVHYQPQTSDTYKLCSECEFYVNPDEPQSPCRKVVGFVDGNGTCDLFLMRSTHASSTKMITITIKS